MSDDGLLAGRPCLVVGGAGGGIGTAVALAAAAAGGQVGVITNRRDHADAVVRAMQPTGARCRATVADVTVERELVEAVALLGEELGTIRHLVNVVGGNEDDDYQRAAQFDTAVLDRVMARNLRYAIVACREVARPLLSSGLSGSMVNVSSGATRGAPLLGAYAAAKAGLEAFSRTAALEWGPRGIRVNVLSLGTIRTPRTGLEDDPGAVASIPLRRRGDPEEAAHAALFLLSDHAGYVTGHTLVVDGGIALGQPGGDEPSRFVSRENVRARFSSF